MKYLNDVLEAIGNTPLIKLNKVADDSMATVLVKAEFMNPGGAIKDRMALHMMREAEAEGTIKPGDTIVENTSGNTGFALAMVAAVKGYRTRDLERYRRQSRLLCCRCWNWWNYQWSGKVLKRAGEGRW